MRMALPETGREWMTDEIRDLLSQIPGPHALKKRATVIKLAFARVNRQTVKEVFREPDVCTEAIWYTKWQYDPAIQAAYQACLQRAYEYADEETVAIETHFRTLRRQSVARYASQAPAALAAVMGDKDSGGGNRIRAALELIGLADPDMERERPALTVEVKELDSLIERELAVLASRGQGSAAAEAETSQSGPDAAGADAAGVDAGPSDDPG